MEVPECSARLREVRLHLWPLKWHTYEALYVLLIMHTQRAEIHEVGEGDDPEVHGAGCAATTAYSPCTRRKRL